jgi:hypothetical protein
VQRATLDTAEGILRRAGCDPDPFEHGIMFTYTDTTWMFIQDDDDSRQFMVAVLLGAAADYTNVPLGAVTSTDDEDLLLTPIELEIDDDGPQLFVVAEFAAADVEDLITILPDVDRSADHYLKRLDSALPASSSAWGFMIALATLHTARAIEADESAEAHRRRMGAAIAEKVALIGDIYGDSLDGKAKKLAPSVVARFLDEGVDGLPDNWGPRLLIDQCFSSPFAPYDVSVTDTALDAGFASTGHAVFGPDPVVEAITRTARLERAQHSALRNMSPAAAGVVALGAAVVLVASHGAALAGMAGGGGLTGAAATAHGLAVLGGGTAHFGMAGGAIVLKAAGGVGVTAIRSGVAPVLGVGGSQAVGFELARLQTQALWYLTEDEWAAARSDLEIQRDELERELAREQEISDPSSRLLKDLRAAIKAIDRAIASVEAPSYAGKDDFAADVDRGLQHVMKKMRRARDHWKDL